MRFSFFLVVAKVLSVVLTVCKSTNQRCVCVEHHDLRDERTRWNNTKPPRMARTRHSLLMHIAIHERFPAPVLEPNNS